MHDSNGKTIHVGDEITCYAFGLCKIIGVQAEHTKADGGTELIVIPQDKKESINIRTEETQVVKVRTWKEMAQEALNVQDASNLSGVLVSFSNICREVRARLEAENKGGSVNLHAHPVLVLYSDKVASLTHSGEGLKYGDAYNWAKDETK